MYGYDKIGSFDNVSCQKCDWKGLRAYLQKYDRYTDEYNEDGEQEWLESYYGCPCCTSEEVV